MKKLRSFAAAALLAGAVGHIGAQEAAPAAPSASTDDEDVIVLSPFEVTAENTGYAAATTLAGNRLNTELRDIGNAVTVITSQFLKDIGATDNKTLLQYTTNTEVGGFYGNFAGFGDSSHLDESGRFTNPNSNTRIRGLTAADNTREYFQTDIPWEGYNVDGVDLQRGPNSILFGQGSPAGIINIRTKQAGFKDSNEATFRVGSWGSTRATLDINKVLLKNELAIRVAAVRNDEEYKQDPAYAEQKRIYGALRWEPKFLKVGSSRTIIKASIEFGDINSNNPRQLPPTDRITPWFYTGTTPGYNIANQPFDFPNLNRITINPGQNEDDNTGVAGHGLNRPSHNGVGGTFAFWTVDGTNPIQIPGADPGTNYLDMNTTPVDAMGDPIPGAMWVNKLLPQYAAQSPAGAFAGLPNEFFQPWISGSQLGVYGSPAFNFQYNDPTQATAVNWEPQGQHGKNPDGSTRVGSVTHYIRTGTIAPYSSYATGARLYYGDLPAWQYGVFKDKSLTDASVFDFYNQLLDGPTKNEFQNFRAINLSLAQTFFHDQVGFEAQYYKEYYKSGRNSTIQDSLNVDINSVYSDGSPYGAITHGDIYQDGTPNPNVGKPFVGGAAGGNVSVSNREDGRLTAFIDHDFAQNSHGWFARLVGRHTVTGLLSGDRQETMNKNYNRYSVDDPDYELVTNSRLKTDPSYVPQSWTANRPYTFFYLGDSLLNASSASGAYIPNPKVNPALVSGQVINFDATWTPSTDPMDPTYVDPGADWHDPYGPTTNVIATDGLFRDGQANVVTSTVDGGTGINYDSTESLNPKNYVGFRPYDINIRDALTSEENLNLNTTGAQANKRKVTSRAFNWQGHFWNNALVATWGVRKDTASAWAASIDTNNAGRGTDSRIDLSRLMLPDDPDNSLTVTSHAWTAVVHLNEMLPVLNKLPVRISVFYNRSSDFQPAAQRVDVYGEPLAAPEGKTIDKGILLESSDGKYSLKVNKYTTSSVRASSAALGGAWFIGASQVWAGNWVNRFEFNWTGDSISNAADPNDADYETNSIDNYAPAPGETQEQAKARELSVIAAWRDWQASVDPRFYSAWHLDLSKNTGLSYAVPNGFAVPEDSVSEGYEIEFNAQPTRNWRISLNASKTTAQRKNIGGANLAEFMAAYTSFLGDGAPGTGGDLRIWWGGAGNETALQEWNGNINSEWNQRKLQEGTDVPELRKWRWNLITNYQFDHGPLKNFNIGGGARYESSIVIGYEPIAGDVVNPLLFDIMNPYRGPSDTNYDLWVGYRRKIWRNIDWNIQLNIRNVGVGNELVPITTEPDGSAATYRIRPPQTWQLTNSFRF